MLLALLGLGRREDVSGVGDAARLLRGARRRELGGPRVELALGAKEAFLARTELLLAGLGALERAGGVARGGPGHLVASAEARDLICGESSISSLAVGFVGPEHLSTAEIESVCVWREIVIRLPVAASLASDAS